MQVSFKKRWKVLVHKKIMQSDFCRTAAVNPSIFTKLYNNQVLLIQLLPRICEPLDSGFRDNFETIREQR